MKNGRGHCSTPQALFDWANERWGPFDLDAAAEPWNAKCDNFYTAEMDSLRLGWYGRVWCNPPWAALAKDAWIAHGMAQVDEGNADLVCFHLPVRTGTDYYQSLLRPYFQEKLIRGRVKYGAPPGTETGSGGFEDTAFYVYERPLQAKDYR